MVGVADRVVAGERIPAQRVGVGVVEGAAPGIEGHAPLAAAGRDAADELLPVPAIAGIGLGAAEPVVEAVHEPVDGVLGVADAVHAGLEHAHVVGDAVVVGVLREHQDRRRDHEQSAAGRLDRPGQDQVGQEVVAHVHDAVPIRVLEHGHAADRLGLAGGLGVAHVAAHLAHPQAPTLVEHDLDRVDDERLLGHQLRDEAGLQAEGLPLGRGAQERRLGDHEVVGQRGLHLPLPVAVLGRGRSGQEDEADEGMDAAHGTAFIMGHPGGGASEARASGTPCAHAAP